jgi:hypothetical protein
VRLPNFTTKIRAKEGAIIQIDKDHSIYSVENKNCLQKNHWFYSKIAYTPEMGKWLESIRCPYFTIGQRKGLNVGRNN